MTPIKKIDAALDSVLMAGGYLALEFALDHRVDAMRLAMRLAMRKIMSDSYLQGADDARHVLREHYKGSSDAQDAMKVK